MFPFLSGGGRVSVPVARVRVASSCLSPAAAVNGVVAVMVSRRVYLHSTRPPRQGEKLRTVFCPSAGRPDSPSPVPLHRSPPARALAHPCAHAKAASLHHRHRLAFCACVLGVCAGACVSALFMALPHIVFFFLGLVRRRC